MNHPIGEQTVLITGAGRGLGAAIATAFAREGARVAINYRHSRNHAEALAASIGPQAAVYQADVSDAQAVQELVARVADELGPPTTLVHNALANFRFNGEARKHLDTLQWSDVAAQGEVAVGGLINALRALDEHFTTHQGGRVITVGTNLFHNPVVPYHDYTAAKAALMAMTRTAARELGPRGVTVNMVAGGLLRTTDASAATPEAVFDLIASQTPLGHVTTPEELADAVLFFASPWARAVTGQTLIVDGGLVCD
ncbi:3-oxoacyl-ACP reductase [Spiribacter insolitus]|uniref:3-oxoacyl-ACP reductase n=1 Tax=Spiribacter insolitus TaxID=3122417 RepID=A0ABV3T5B5_9GAMM